MSILHWIRRALRSGERGPLSNATRMPSLPHRRRGVIEALEDRRLLSVGPGDDSSTAFGPLEIGETPLAISSIAPDLTGTPPSLSALDVTFNQPIDPASFSESDVALLDLKNLDFSPLGFYGGAFYDSVIDGSLLYAATNNGLQILDVSNPADVTRLGKYSTPDTAWSVQVVGTVAYVTSYSAGLEILDVSDPSAVTRLGGYDTPGLSRDVCVVGSVAYIADMHGDLQILDVSNPAAVTPLGEHHTPGSAYGVAVVGNVAYVVSSTYGLHILDVADPGAVTALGVYDTTGYARGLQVEGGVAYVADYHGGLQILDVSNPTAVTRLGGYDTPGYAWDVLVVGSVAYVADYDEGIHVLDVANPAAVVYLRGYDTPGWAYDVQVADAVAYVADYDAGLHILDIAGPGAVMRLGGYDNVRPEEMHFEGDLAYAADGTDGLHILDVTDPDAITRLGGYDTSGSARDVHVVGNLAYVADDSAGLQILDVPDPHAVTRLGGCDTTGYAYSVQVIGDLAYVADRGAGLQILDVSDPAAVTRLGGYDTPSLALDVQVIGNVAYVADHAGLEILDVTDPTAVTRLGGYIGPGSFSNVQVVGTTAYCATLVSGLQVFDVSDPTAVTRQGAYTNSGDVRSVQVVGSVAYVVDDYNDLHIMDVSIPAEIVPLDWYDTPTFAYDVHLSGGVAYVCDSYAGLQVVQVGAMAASISHISDNTYRVDLGHTLPDGEYALLLGPEVLDLYGTPMDQDQDGTPREESDDIYFSRFQTHFVDFGDAPTPYPTLGSENGACHLAGGPMLGADRDYESDGVHSPLADHDDNNGTAADDEDGVTFGAMHVGLIGASAVVNVRNAFSGARLDAWIDFDGDGTWQEPSERIADSLVVSTGDNTVTFDIPTWAVPETIYARFRLSTAGGLGVTGAAIDGEVEDHVVLLQTPQPGIYGTVWDDRDIDGLFDARETGLAARTVFIDDDADGQLDAGETSTVTDADGAYELPNPGAGTYEVAVLVDQGWIPTAPADASHTVTLSGGDMVLGVDFGLAVPRIHVDVAATPGGDGLYWDTAYNDLDLGIDAAASLAIPGIEQVEIWIAQGTYLPTRLQDSANPRTATFTMQSNTTLIGGFAGVEISVQERLRDADGLLVHATTLSGDLGVADEPADNAYTVVFAESQTNLTLDGLTIADGYANGSGADQYGSGGGIAVYDTSVDISDVTLIDNSCSYWGGALRAISSTLNVTGSRFYSNQTERNGGAINIDLSDSSQISGSVFEANTAGNRSGAIEIYRTSMIVEDTVFQRNEAVNAGGAVFNTGGNVTYNRVAFLENTTGGSGGAVYIAGDASIVECSFLANSALYGGAIRDGSGANNPITQSRFIGNTASQAGGAIYGYETFLHYSTITQNHSVTGGGICAASGVWITSSIVAGNTVDATGSGPDLIGSLDAESEHMLIGDSSDWTQAGSFMGQGGNIIGTSAAPVDPLFVRIPSDGGDGWGDDPSTAAVDESANDDFGDLHLQPASPAVNGGAAVAWPALATDLDGHPRIVHGQIDMGAYEYQDQGGPTADAGGPYGVAPGGTVQLDASASSDPDLPGDILSYAWDFDGDGLFDDATGVSPEFAATGLADGTFVTIALQVTDAEHATHTDTARVYVFVSPVVLTGTTGDDICVVTVGTVAEQTDHVVEINGVASVYSPIFVSDILIIGSGGNDSVTIHATSQREIVRVRPGLTDVFALTYAIQAEGFEHVTIDAGSGRDQVTMTGSAGSNRLYSYPGYSRMSDSPNTYSYRVERSETVSVDVPAGDRNYAFLYDSSQNDVLYANPTEVVFFRMVETADEAVSKITGFGRVYSYATGGGTDYATLTGADTATNRFYGYADYGILTESTRSFYFYARGFGTVAAESPSSEVSCAYLYDGPGQDSLAASPDSATMTRSGPASASTATGFQRLYAYSTRGGDDAAQLTGSAAGGNDYRGYPTYSTLTDRARTFYHYASGFRTVTATGSTTDTTGDRAYLYDSPGDDTLYGRQAQCYLEDTAQTTYHNEVLYFDYVFARSTDDATTNDTVNVDDLTFYLLKYGSWS